MSAAGVSNPDWWMGVTDDVRILVAAQSVKAVADPSDLEPGAQGPEAGRIRWEGQDHPVFRFDRDFNLIPRQGNEATVLLLTHRSRSFGLLCHAAAVLESSTSIILKPVPEPLRSPTSPICNLALTNGLEVACVMDVRELAQLLGLRSGGKRAAPSLRAKGDSKDKSSD